MSAANNKSLSEIVLLTHGGWGAQLCDSLKMVVGETAGVSSLSLEPADTFDEFYQKVEAVVSALAPGSLILTDFIGGTPSNVAARLSADYPIAVICGLNASLLLEALEQRSARLLADCVNELVEAGRASCLDVVSHVNALTSSH